MLLTYVFPEHEHRAIKGALVEGIGTVKLYQIEEFEQIEGNAIVVFEVGLPVVQILQV